MYVISPDGRADDDLRGAAVRIVIAEDSVLLRAGLTRILADAGEEVVATVGAADELMAAVERHQPDLCIVDVRMPPTHTDDGLRAAIAIRQRWPKIGILVLSQYVEERYATDLLADETRADRLPAEGPRRRRRRVPRRRAPRRRRRHGARPRGRRPAAGPARGGATRSSG